MQLSRLSRQVRSPLFNSLIVIGGALLSRITGLARDVVISARFGTDADLGAYYAAFRVTDLLYMVIIGGALGSSFIPVFIQVWQRDGSERAWHLASAVVTWALALLALASALLWVLAPQLTVWFFDATETNIALTARIIRLFLLSPLLLGLGGLAMAALNAQDRFTLPALAPAIYNLGIIGGAIFLVPFLDIWGLAWGVIIGAGLYLLVQIPGLWGMGMRLHLTLGRGMLELKTIAQQMTPRVFGQAAAQISLLVTAALTTWLTLGFERLAGLNYAYQLMLLPYGVFSLSLSTVAYPRLARLIAENRHAELDASVRNTLSTILFLTIPATVALVILAVPLVRLLYQRFAFDQTSLLYTVMPLLGYATALPAFAAAEILIRAFYAMQQTWTPVLIGLLQVTLNLGVGTLALLSGGGVVALTLAFSLATNVELLLLLIMLGRRRPGIWGERTLWRSLGATVLATGGLALLLWVVRRFSLPWLPFLALSGSYAWRQDMLLLLVWVAVVGGVGSLGYLGMAAALGSREAREVGARLRTRLRLGRG
ncbi:MAG: murein biosynthesis integral membrane protein MurJ [Chloroflexaceae bacterium]